MRGNNIVKDNFYTETFSLKSLRMQHCLGPVQYKMSCKH